MASIDSYKRYISTHYQYVTNDRGYINRYYLWKSYFEKILPENKNIAILEVGSGMGHNIFALKKLGYTNISGIDYSPECVAFCNKKGYQTALIDNKKEQQFYASHARSYDLIVLYDVLEHYVPDDALKLLRNIKNALTENGIILISTPNADHPLCSSLRYADITHKFIYTEGSLSQLLRNGGLTRHRFFQVNSYTTYDDNMFYKIIKNTILRLVAFVGEFFWKIIGLTQGIIFSDCKPTLIAVIQK